MSSRVASAGIKEPQGGNPMTDANTTKPAAALADLVLTASDPAAKNWVERFRNDLAAFGPAAVEAVRPWLSDPVLGPRAVTVIERAAAQHGSRAAAGRVSGLRSGTLTLPAIGTSSGLRWNDFTWQDAQHPDCRGTRTHCHLVRTSPPPIR